MHHLDDTAKVKRPVKHAISCARFLGPEKMPDWCIAYPEEKPSIALLTVNH